MNKELIPYEFQGKPVRVIMGMNGKPMFIARDVCAILEIYTSVAVNGRLRSGKFSRGLDPDEKATAQIGTPRGQQKMLIVTESGLYQLVLKSHTEKAREFKRWITYVVLPSIRNTGTYSIHPPSPVDPSIDDFIDIRQQRHANFETSIAWINQEIQKLSEIQKSTKTTAADLDESFNLLTRSYSFERRQKEMDEALIPSPFISAKEKILRVLQNYADRHGYDVNNITVVLFYAFKKRYGIDAGQLSREAGNQDRYDIVKNLQCMDMLLRLAIELFLGIRYPVKGKR